MSARAGTKLILEVLLLSYLVTSLFHFIQDAEYAQAYPMSGWKSLPSVYGTWLSISAIGLLGYFLHRSTLRWVGQILLSLYAAVGLDGLLHYTRAPMSAYSLSMNISIWLEVLLASILLIYLLVTAKRLGAQ